MMELSTIDKYFILTVESDIEEEATYHGGLE